MLRAGLFTVIREWGEFPGSLAVKTLSFHWPGGQGFNPLLGNYDPASCEAQPKRKQWGKCKCLSTDEWIYVSIHSSECYPEIKRNEVPIQVTMCMSLENITVSERSQSPKATYCRIPFTRSVQNRQIHRDGKRMSGCQRLRHRDTDSLSIY